jgi:hypothetical protein
MSQDKDVADALQQIARALILLGNAGATMPDGSQWGALEAHGKAITDAGDKIAAGLHDVAAAIRETNGQ